MATVSTTTGTYLENLFDPQVVADLIDTKLIDNIVFAPLARVDNTLNGRAGDTVTLPYYNYIGPAEVVEEGTDIPIAQLTQATKEVKIQKIGKGTQLTDEAVLSGYGDPLGEAVSQVVKAIADKVDNILLDDMNRNAVKVYQPAGELTADDLPLALALFGEDTVGDKALLCSPEFYAALLKGNWVPASEIAANIKIRGALGMAYGCQVITTNRLRGNNFFIVTREALAIFMKRDTMVERDRDIVNQSTFIIGSKLFAPYLQNTNGVVKIVNGMDAALDKITIEAAIGINVGDTKLTMTGYTPGTGESYKYKVGDTATNLYLGEEVEGFTDWNGTTDITAAAGKVITVVSVDTDGKAVAAGTVVSVPKT
ncbi:MAG: N4-gp56 family major capsid protein [Clostridia bacterium]|nr:N4-gp56 family major capsid protein [Clostridia bacterium]